MPKFDVYSMCNPLFDLQADVSEELLQALGFEKGGMFLLEREEQRELTGKVYEHIVNAAPGGSGANTAIGIAMLGGKASYTGRVADDEHGEGFIRGLHEKGVKANCAKGSGMTGVCVVLVTPDAQRTMFTCLGSSRELCADDVIGDDIEQSKFIYVTGYLWDTDGQKEAVLHAMRTAKDHGTKVVLSLSDPFCVNRHREDFNQIIDEFVDVVIGNDREAAILTSAESVEESACLLSERTEVAAVTQDSRGSVICGNGRLHRINSFQVDAIDTTGAGDCYAAGLLFALSRGLDHETAGHLASYMGAQCVAKLGPRVEAVDTESVRRIVGGRI